MARILLRFRLLDDYIAPLTGRHEVVHEPDDRVDVLLTTSMNGAPRDLLDRLPGLRLLICFGSGYEGIDLDDARRRGLRVVNGAGTNYESVADMTFGLLLAAGRRIVEGDRYIRAGQWGMAPRPGIVPAVHGARLGILGLGQVGMAIAQRAQGFAMQIAYHNTRPRDVPYEYVNSAMALAEWADFLVVALRADDNNRHLVNEALLRALGPDGVLINISRGSVVDEDALARALTEGWIRGAALDVYAEEPPRNAALLAAPNTVLTPHVAAYTTRAIEDAMKLAAANIDAYEAGRPLLTPVL